MRCFGKLLWQVFKEWTQKTFLLQISTTFRTEMYNYLGT